MSPSGAVPTEPGNSFAANGGIRQLGEHVIAQGAVVGFLQGTFVDPDGNVFRRDIVRHPGAVSVVAVADEGSALGSAGPAVWMVRQYRAALDMTVLEIPAGKRDVADELPELTAARELAEEVGLSAEQWELLTAFYPSPGFCDELCYIYLARNLSSAPRALQGIEESLMTLELLPFADLDDAIASGELRDAKSIIGLLLARDRLGLGPQTP